MADSKSETKKEEAKKPDEVISSSGGSDIKTNSMLCWLVVALVGLPITSFIWMNDENEELRWHAKMTLWLGLAVVAAYIVIFVLGFIGSFFVIGMCCFLAYPIVWLAQIGLGVMGAVKANNGERFEIPVLKDMVK